MLWYWAETLSTGHKIQSLALDRNFTQLAENIKFSHWAETLSTRNAFMLRVTEIIVSVCILERSVRNVFQGVYSGAKHQKFFEGVYCGAKSRKNFQGVYSGAKRREKLGSEIGKLTPPPHTLF